ncbi:hypothetical protein TSUD_133250 [Trifolium subterraneum]|uniref:Uncharacterized protein n=1 Tax=Trifolium subterraneum TaxID=3900 RepID=A0A2Z6PEW7_TRISU|nr:hypothetical protein TSUD_133250 [Trifolium subterraneum]
MLKFKLQIRTPDSTVPFLNLKLRFKRDSNSFNNIYPSMRFKLVQDRYDFNSTKDERDAVRTQNSSWETRLQFTVGGSNGHFELNVAILMNENEQSKVLVEDLKVVLSLRSDISQSFKHGLMSIYILTCLIRN